MKGKYKVLLSIIVILIIIIIMFLCMSSISKKESIDIIDNNVEIPVLENIEEFGYSLHERDSLVMKENYEELKEILSEEEIDYDAYAKTLAKLFVIDLWTMNNKTNRYDVGSVEYIYPDNVANYKLNVENTIYKVIENNVNGSRKQELPAVNSILNIELKHDKYIINDKDNDSYVVTLEWNYDTDLGYESKSTITMIKLDKKLYVVEYVPGE